MTRATTQKAILTTDAEETAVSKATRTTAKKFSKSRKRTSLDEFSIVNNLRPEVKAGFKAWLEGKYFHFDNEWKNLFEEYSNR